MRVQVLTDTHAPFMHPDAINFLSAVSDRYSPEVIVHGGDVADFHFASKHVKEPRNAGASEIAKARRQLAGLVRLYPRALVCVGNHDERVYKRNKENGIPEDCVKKLNEILSLPDEWEWRDSWVIDGVIYEHGSQYGGHDGHIKAARTNLASTVIGHIHSHAGVHYVANTRSTVFGMNAGCLIDRTAYAFNYAKRQALPVVGCGIVTDGIPMFLPMRLNARGRWTKRL